LTNYTFATVINTFYLSFAMGAVMVIEQNLSKETQLV
jgi:hypothetical protein